MGRVHPPLFCRAAFCRRAGRRPRRDRGLGAADLWLGRSPNYKAAFLATLGANAEFYAPYQDNARRWYRYSQERVPFVNHALVQPPVDRNIAPGAPGGPTDVYARVTKETDAGVHVTGAKVVATGSVLTHFTFVGHVGLLPVQDKNYAIVFLVPTNAPGVKFICRVSNEQRAAVLGTPFRLSAVEPPRRKRRDLYHG
jgi:aromatic ring hydroxylase